MKVVEILKLSQNLLNLLQNACIKIEHVRYIGLYDEYVGFIKKGFKKSWAVSFLAEKYEISVRQVYYILKRFAEDCNLCAEG